MIKVVLEPGTIVKINGIPVELVGSTEVMTAEQNESLVRELLPPSTSGYSASALARNEGWGLGSKFA